MKKLFLILLMLSGMTFAQTLGVSVGGGTVWTDSLGYTNLNETSDSVLILDLKFSKGWIHLFIEGNATAQADSFYVQAGAIRYDEAKDAQDTIWGSYVAFKDSSWSDINILINNTVGKDFLMFRPVTQLLRFTLLNYRLAIPTRNLVITIQAMKP